MILYPQLFFNLIDFDDLIDFSLIQVQMPSINFVIIKQRILLHNSLDSFSVYEIFLNHNTIFNAYYHALFTEKAAETISVACKNLIFFFYKSVSPILKNP